MFNVFMSGLCAGGALYQVGFGNWIMAISLGMVSLANLAVAKAKAAEVADKLNAAETTVDSIKERLDTSKEKNQDGAE